MPQPNKIPRPFADSGDKNTIPESSGALGFASWQEGFPAITGTPFAQGGVAPKRADFNGIFNALSAAAVWYQQGGIFAYDNATDYEIGNVVVYSGDIYVCFVANGPGSTVKSPTDFTVWKKLILTNATTSADGYMSKDDKNAVSNAYMPIGSAFTLGPTYCGGYVTTGATSLRFTIPTSVVIPLTASIHSVTTSAIAIRTVSGGNLDLSGLPHTESFSLSSVGVNALFSFSSALNVANNTPVGVNFNGTIELE